MQHTMNYVCCNISKSTDLTLIVVNIFTLQEKIKFNLPQAITTYNADSLTILQLSSLMI